MKFFRNFWRRHPQAPLALGRIVVTPAAAMALERARLPVQTLLDRHAAGDWGEVDAVDWRQNILGLRLGLRVRSAYLLNESAGNAAPITCWVITTPNRLTTTVLLPSEIFNESNNDHE